LSICHVDILVKLAKPTVVTAEWRWLCLVSHNSVKVKVKFSRTRYRALGPELIPVYRQSARRWREVIHAINPAVVCHCFLPGLRLPSQLSPDGATCKRQHTSSQLSKSGKCRLTCRHSYADFSVLCYCCCANLTLFTLYVGVQSTWQKPQDWLVATMSFVLLSKSPV